ncbi:hypothetical protein KQI76_02085 [Amphibacillus sp. MSJ-3]|nr:hypothetical protein [Amphibacillus sp. MSJ-3]MBU5593941.1 hypothetical protein [Amphibacillus sp. MSJ-3]
MSNRNSNVELEKNEVANLKTKRKSIMNQLVASLCAEGIDAKLVKKINYQ